MKKGFVVIMTIMAVLWTSAAFIVAQKSTYKIKDGECTKQKVLVPTIIGPRCKPTIMIRDCNKTNTDYPIKCSGKCSIN